MAESYRDDQRTSRGEQSTLAGVVVRASRVVDGFAFASCRVGEMDATTSIAGLVEALDREDVRYLLVGGVALAWYNLLDLDGLHRAVGRPVVSVTFEESAGLERALEEAFEGVALDRRLAAYRALPERHAVSVNGETVYVRAVGLDPGEARDVVRAFTPEGGRPEPLRVARLAARAADAWRIPDARDTDSVATDDG